MSISTSNQNNVDLQREVISFEVEEGFTSIRGLSPKRLRFGIEYGLERGTTSNSFVITNNLLKGTSSKCPILIHPPGQNFADNFLPTLQKILPTSHKEILVIVGHINPNRVSLLKRLVEIYINIRFVCSAPGAKLLKEIWTENRQQIEKQKNLQLPEILIIKKPQIITAPNGYSLELIPAPTARWPGELLVFEKKLGILMSDKFFAAHLCTKEWAEQNRISTDEDRRYYFDCLMSSMSSQIDIVIDRLEELDISTIAPGHGPAIEASWRSLLNDYRRWGENQQRSTLKVVLLFASAYGNTATIANALATGISRTGVCVDILNCEFTSSETLVNTIKKADAYLIGSPTLGGHAPTPIMSALGTLLAEGSRDKPVGVFGSYGWSGEALDLLENRLKDAGFEFGFKSIKIKFTPNSLLLKTLEETGTLFGRNLLKKQNQQKRRASGGLTTSKSDPKILALGRVVGSLCILTTLKGKEDNIIKGGMVASWVSQASFNPPGITIAIAKDRSVEALLHCGDSFTLNILAEGKHQTLMRQFLQPFSPGEDRFNGLNIAFSPTGQPILREALAYLDGLVSKRMECGDHWLIYGEITSGKILDLDGKTAIHHRRSGANY